MPCLLFDSQLKDLNVHEDSQIVGNYGFQDFDRLIKSGLKSKSPISKAQESCEKTLKEPGASFSSHRYPKFWVIDGRCLVLSLIESIQSISKFETDLVLSDSAF